MKKQIVVVALLFVLASVPLSNVFAQEPDMSYIADVTIPDDTILQPGEVFTKTWRLQNTGGVNWLDYSLQFVSGNQMDGNPLEVAQTDTGETAEVTVICIAPDTNGTYTGRWALVDRAGNQVGNSFYTRIMVGENGIIAEPTSEPNEETITEIHTDFSGEPFAGKAPLLDNPDYPYNQIFQEGGLLHFKQVKTRLDDGEWMQDWTLWRCEERANFTDMTLDVEMGRLDGEGWAGGAAAVYFGVRDGNNLYYLLVTRTTQQWSVWKVIDGDYSAVFPPSDSPNLWDKGATINAPDLETREAWDWIKLVCETVEGGTRIAVYSKGTLLGETIDDTYQGGYIGLGTRTWGSSSHTVFAHLHVVPYIHYD